MQRMCAIILVVATSIPLYGKRTQPMRDSSTPRVAITNRQQNSIDVDVITRKNVHAQNRDASSRGVYVRRSLTVYPGFEHNVMIEAGAEPVAIVVHGDSLKEKPSVKLSGSPQLTQQPRLLHKQHTGRVDLQELPHYLQELVQEIGNSQLALLELNMDWLNKYPQATISLDITPDGNIRITR